MEHYYTTMSQSMNDDEILDVVIMMVAMTQADDFPPQQWSH